MQKFLFSCFFGNKIKKSCWSWKKWNKTKRGKNERNKNLSNAGKNKTRQTEAKQGKKSLMQTVISVRSSEFAKRSFRKVPCGTNLSETKKLKDVSGLSFKDDQDDKRCLTKLKWFHLALPIGNAWCWWMQRKDRNKKIFLVIQNFYLRFLLKYLFWFMEWVSLLNPPKVSKMSENLLVGWEMSVGSISSRTCLKKLTFKSKACLPNK